MSDEVLTERRGRTLVVTINRPQARNAVNGAVSRGLAAAVDELDDSDDLSVAVITGAGGNFCAGMDLKAFAAGEDVTVEGRGLGFTSQPPRKPMISAVEGFALAGGTELVLATDLVVASTTAKFGIPEVKRGLVAAGGGLLRLPERIPYQRAMELALTGDNFDAEEGFRLGFVNRLTEPGEALAAALELADKIAANGPLAVAATKQVLVAARDWPSDQFFAKQAEITGPVFVSEDAREGATAFAEKRPAVWKGR
ncbi:crotonase/enoyl-CoA hydratase family protein [Rhodococcus triatomae]|uniref:Enoyl-CoA hydratase n=1 Tax=Rhodococcus triatomae TaxID=300028 RepID=A0A1G8GEJ2_9NOCA|nr:crotonase/enoyl-CoA hydratase family protein [Rhodococcus triatomae]QNG20404.1 crotonase/enoyl-CoA hydratase family protein [Rhodococcus triatomae]QNG23680.1 crotonase/enoyl-CoA hydratase family protein [Rhodococcus triatomae]SDH92717.1 enoyl-CoA hydratase [Rhodococcus triatomae]